LDIKENWHHKYQNKISSEKNYREKKLQERKNKKHKLITTRETRTQGKKITGKEKQKA
jgi:hypothetical protein